MKILHINIDYRYSGGVGTYLLSLLKELEENGHENIMVYGLEPQEKPEGKKSYFISSVASSSFFPPKEDLELLENILKSEKPDIIHIHDCDNYYISR